MRLPTEYKVDALCVYTLCFASRVDKLFSWPFPTLDDVANFLFSLKPPSAAVSAVEVELDVFISNLEVLDLVASWQLLLCLSNLGHNLLDELACLDFQFGLDVVC